MRDATVERRELRDAFQTLLEHVADGHVDSDDPSDRERRAAAWDEIVESGLLDLSDEEGGDASVIDATILLVALGRSGLAQPVGAALVASSVLRQAGGHDQLVQGIVAGQRVCLVDPHRREGDFATEAEHYLVVGPESLHLADRAAVTLGGARGTDAARDLRAVDVDLDLAVRLETPADALSDALLRRQLADAAELVGVLDGIVDQTLKFLGQRRQFGRVIGGFQAVKHGVVDVVVQLEAGRALLYRAARLLDEQDSAREVAVMAACSRLARASRELCATAFQYHGAIAHTWEFDLHVRIKRAMALQLSGGATERARERIAHHVIDLASV